MDIQPQSTQPINDDQELAKVLAGVSTSGTTDIDGTPAMSDIPAPMAAGDPPTAPGDSNTPEAMALPVLPTPDFMPSTSTPAPSGSNDLDDVKQDAINELRPLVDKLTLSPEEKFDTYLLLIRSTDDKTLVAPAHEAAKAITDESRRAQALLDIIKEIDFLSQAK